MSQRENENRRGLNKNIVLFFVFAILCVAAFLIVLLVKSCDADHEEKVIDQELQQEDLGMKVSSNDNILMIG